MQAPWKIGTPPGFGLSFRFEGAPMSGVPECSAWLKSRDKQATPNGRGHLEESIFKTTGTLYNGWPKALASAYNLEELVILRIPHPSRALLSVAENRRLRTETLVKGLLVGKHWPQLNSFSLVNFPMHSTDLRDVVLRHRQKLTYVGLTNFHVNDGLWREALGLPKVQLELSAASIMFDVCTQRKNHFREFMQDHDLMRASSYHMDVGSYVVAAPPCH